MDKPLESMASYTVARKTRSMNTYEEFYYSLEKEGAPYLTSPLSEALIHAGKGVKNLVSTGKHKATTIQANPRVQDSYIRFANNFTGDTNDVYQHLASEALAHGKGLMGKAKNFLNPKVIRNPTPTPRATPANVGSRYIAKSPNVATRGQGINPSSLRANDPLPLNKTSSFSMTKQALNKYSSFYDQLGTRTKQASILDLIS